MNTIEEAFTALENQEEGIPFEAIEFLYKHPEHEAIQQKIIFALTHAYDEEVYYDTDKDYYRPIPIWYAIVAENHLSEDIIDPVIQLFTTTDEDWDFLNEQGAYLLGALAEKFPDATAEKVIPAIEEQAARKSETPYLFLMDFMYFIDIEKYKSRLLRLLEDPGLYWQDAFAMRFADLQIKEAVPVIQRLLKKNLDKFTRNELEGSLEVLEKGQIEYPEYAKPYVKQRKFWKEHYKAFDKIFYSDYEPEESPLAKKARELQEAQQALDEIESFRRGFSKIGRNERISVRYSDGRIVHDIKFKKVEDDLLEGRCEMI